MLYEFCLEFPCSALEDVYRNAIREVKDLSEKNSFQLGKAKTSKCTGTVTRRQVLWGETALAKDW